MTTNYADIIEIIRDSTLIAEAKKSEFIAVLSQGEPFSAEFTQEFGEFLGAEYGLLNEREAHLARELAKAQEAQNTGPKKRRVVVEHKKIVDGIVENFERDARNLATTHDQKVEKIVREQGEGAQIDALRAKLKS